MTELQQYLYQTLVDKCKLHNLISGEIIICYEYFTEKERTIDELVKLFFVKNSIQVVLENFDLIEITQQKAIYSIHYGLSTKPNYTNIEIEFSEHDKNSIVYSFFQLFNKPRYYTINAKIYKTDLDINDFWESGGAIVIDNQSIGILWVNDLYNKF